MEKSTDRILGVIAARGGSKGLPGKNIRKLGGKPLIEWSVKTAMQSLTLTDCIVSTDSEEISEAAKVAGAKVPFRRPDELADDAASIVDVVLHAVDQMGGAFDIVVLLQATSPFRTAGDIDNCVNHLIDTGAPSCISVCESGKSPYWMLLREDNGLMAPLIPSQNNQFVRRQELQKTYQPNGAIYATRVDWLRQHGSFYGTGMQSIVMPAERSIDIDTHLDFLVARAQLELL
jgi:CMP-N,N'-diacetyllegionaminic acid synthase